VSNWAYFTQLAPEWILLIGACGVLFAGGARSRATAALGSVVTVLAALVASLMQGVPEGEFNTLGLWLTPVTYYTRTIALAVGLTVVLVNWHQPAISERGEYLSMILFSLLGVLLTASANDVVVLFFAIELVSVPTYVLVGLSQADARASEAAVKYFFLGALAAALLAYGLSFWYGAAGTTTMHRLLGGNMTSTLPMDAGTGGYALIGFLLVLAALAFKVAAVPLHAYAPDVYEGAAAPVTGFLGFAPKLAGFVALIKVFSACSWQFPNAVFWLVWAMAAATMTTGNVLALLQHNVKRILAYSSIAHSGYMLIGLLVGPAAGEGPLRDGVAAILFYVAVYATMNLGAFALLSAFRNGEKPVETLEDLHGLSDRAPMAALAFAICVFSLMGLPPTAGFLGKVYVFGSAFSSGENHEFHEALVALAIIGVVNSAIGAAYYLRIVAAAYIPRAESRLAAIGGIPVRLGLGLCALPLLLFFGWPAGLADRSRIAASVAAQSLASRQESTSYAAAPAAEAGSGRSKTTDKSLQSGH